jgi:hypothetical protein
MCPYHGLLVILGFHGDKLHFYNPCPAIEKNLLSFAVIDLGFCNAEIISKKEVSQDEIPCENGFLVRNLCIKLERKGDEVLITYSVINETVNNSLLNGKSYLKEEEPALKWLETLLPYSIQRNFYDSFQIHDILGSGSFGKVILASKNRAPAHLDA